MLITVSDVQYKAHLAQKSLLSFNSANPIWAHWAQNLSEDIFCPLTKFPLKVWKNCKNALMQVWQQRKHLIVFLLADNNVPNVSMCIFRLHDFRRIFNEYYDSDDSRFTSLNTVIMSVQKTWSIVYESLLWYLYGVCCLFCHWQFKVTFTFTVLKTVACTSSLTLCE